MGNILSLSDLAPIPGVYIIMDAREKRELVVHYKEATLRFIECKEGLYYSGMAESDNSNTSVTTYSCLQFVKNNKKYYTNSEIKGAKTARRIQQELGWPSTESYKLLVKNNLLINSPITSDNINRAKHIFGEPIPLIKVIMVRTVPIKDRIEGIPLPLPIAQRYKEVQLYIDFCIRFTASNIIRFSSVVNS